MKRIYIGLPCYNEEKDISTLLDRILKIKNEIQEKFNIDVKIFCVNDGSKDNTKAIIEERKKDGIKLINHETNQGLGCAMRTILKEFITEGREEDCLVVMDSDNSHNPKYILDFLNKQKNCQCDIVIASRYKDASKINGLKKYRILLSDFARIWYTKMLKIPNVKDYTCGYRLYTFDIIKKTYEKYDNDIITQSSFACMMELLYKTSLSGAKIEEVPFVLEYDLKNGKSKMQVIKTSINSIKTTIKIKREKNK